MSDPAPLVLRVLQAPEGSALVPGATLALRGPTAVVGRAPEADVVLGDRTVSRAHLRIHVGPPVQIEALTASNGTFLDGKPLQPGVLWPLPPEGARLQLGGVLLAIVPLAETHPVLKPLDRLVEPTVLTVPEPILTVRWDAGQCLVRCGSADLGLKGAAARLLGLLASAAGEVVHQWDLHGDLDTPHLAPLATAVRRALISAVEAGHLDEALLRARLQAGALGSEPEAAGDLAQLMRLVVHARRGHGYVLHLLPEDVVVVQL